MSRACWPAGLPLRPALLLAAACAALAPAARAEPQPLWELGLGAGVLRLPHYRGSDQSHTWLLPVPYVVYRGRIFKADRNGARAVLYESSRVDFDLSAAAGAPTRSRNDNARRGMDDLPGTVELGPNLNFTLARGERLAGSLGGDWKLDLRAPVRAAVTLESRPKSIGWVAAPNLNLDVRDVAGGWNLGLQGALLYGNRRYHAHYYEVTPAQALPDRPAYRAEAGYGGAQFTTALSRRSGRNWVGMFARYDTLSGAVFADSPLVRQRQHWSAGFAYIRVFATSSRTVDDNE
jgi:outer membrane scaffolding protein for murein synthesis (MipA/OmpV family)